MFQPLSEKKKEIQVVSNNVVGEKPATVFSRGSFPTVPQWMPGYIPTDPSNTIYGIYGDLILTSTRKGMAISKDRGLSWHMAGVNYGDYEEDKIVAEEVISHQLKVRENVFAIASTNVTGIVISYDNLESFQKITHSSTENGTVAPTLFVAHDNKYIYYVYIDDHSGNSRTHVKRLNIDTGVFDNVTVTSYEDNLSSVIVVQNKYTDIFYLAYVDATTGTMSIASSVDGLTFSKISDVPITADVGESVYTLICNDKYIAIAYKTKNVIYVSSDDGVTWTATVDIGTRLLNFDFSNSTTIIGTLIDGVYDATDANYHLIDKDHYGYFTVDLTDLTIVKKTANQIPGLSNFMRDHVDYDAGVNSLRDIKPLGYLKNEERSEEYIVFGENIFVSTDGLQTFHSWNKWSHKNTFTHRAGGETTKIVTDGKTMIAIDAIDSLYISYNNGRHWNYFPASSLNDDSIQEYDLGEVFDKVSCAAVEDDLIVIGNKFDDVGLVISTDRMITYAPKVFAGVVGSGENTFLDVAIHNGIIYLSYANGIRISSDSGNIWIDYADRVLNINHMLMKEEDGTLYMYAATFDPVMDRQHEKNQFLTNIHMGQNHLYKIDMAIFIAGTGNDGVELITSFDKELNADLYKGCWASPTGINDLGDEGIAVTVLAHPLITVSPDGEVRNLIPFNYENVLNEDIDHINSERRIPGINPNLANTLMQMGPEPSPRTYHMIDKENGMGYVASPNGKYMVFGGLENSDPDVSIITKGSNVLYDGDYWDTSAMHFSALILPNQEFVTVDKQLMFFTLGVDNNLLLYHKRVPDRISIMAGATHLYSIELAKFGKHDRYLIDVSLIQLAIDSLDCHIFINGLHALKINVVANLIVQDPTTADGPYISIGSDLDDAVDMTDAYITSGIAYVKIFAGGTKFTNREVEANYLFYREYLGRPSNIHKDINIRSVVKFGDNYLVAVGSRGLFLTDDLSSIGSWEQIRINNVNVPVTVNHINFDEENKLIYVSTDNGVSTLNTKLELVNHINNKLDYISQYGILHSPGIKRLSEDGIVPFHGNTVNRRGFYSVDKNFSSLNQISLGNGGQEHGRTIDSEGPIIVTIAGGAGVDREISLSLDSGITYVKLDFEKLGIDTFVTQDVTIKNGIIYILTKNGLILSRDNGRTWESYTSLFDSIVDNAKLTIIDNGMIFIAESLQNLYIYQDTGTEVISLYKKDINAMVSAELSTVLIRYYSIEFYNDMIFLSITSNNIDLSYNGLPLIILYGTDYNSVREFSTSESINIGAINSSRVIQTNSGEFIVAIRMGNNITGVGYLGIFISYNNAETWILVKHIGHEITPIEGIGNNAMGMSYDKKKNTIEYTPYSYTGIKELDCSILVNKAKEIMVNYTGDTTANVIISPDISPDISHNPISLDYKGSNKIQDTSIDIFHELSSTVEHSLPSYHDSGILRDYSSETIINFIGTIFDSQHHIIEDTFTKRFRIDPKTNLNALKTVDNILIDDKEVLISDESLNGLSSYVEDAENLNALTSILSAVYKKL